MRASKWLIFLGALLLPVAGQAATLKVATWNIANLRAGDNEGPNRRTAADFSRLAGYAAALDADVIALQEVDGEAAAARVFNPVDYRFFFSRRDDEQRTGFAVRRHLAAEQHSDFEALDVTGGLRHGTDITVTVEGQPLRMLSVHLKSGCWGDPLDTNSDACRKLGQQLPVLEEWIDARAAEGVPSLVLGDFNRRFGEPGDTFWPEIDDADPENADLTRITENLTSACWGGEFPKYIDHIVLDRTASGWIVPNSFQQLGYLEPRSLKRKLSDHCPIGITLDLTGEAAPEPLPGDVRTELLRRIEVIEIELQSIKDGVERMPE